MEFIYLGNSMLLWLQPKDQIVPELGAESLACGTQEGGGFYSLGEEEEAFINNLICTSHRATCGETWGPTWASPYATALDSFISTDEWPVPIAGFSARPDLNTEASAYRQTAVLQRHRVLGGLGLLHVRTRVISVYLCMCTFIYANTKVQDQRHPATSGCPCSIQARPAHSSHLSTLSIVPEGDGGAEPKGEDTSPDKMKGNSRKTCHCGSSIKKDMSCKDTSVSF